MWTWQGFQYASLPIVWLNVAIQWTGKLTLDITKWFIGIFEVVFLWFYGIYLAVFNWWKYYFIALALLIPAPKWPKEPA